MGKEWAEEWGEEWAGQRSPARPAARPRSWRGLESLQVCRSSYVIPDRVGVHRPPWQHPLSPYLCLLSGLVLWAMRHSTFRELLWALRPGFYWYCLLTPHRLLVYNIHIYFPNILCENRFFLMSALSLFPIIQIVFFSFLCKMAPSHSHAKSKINYPCSFFGSMLTLVHAFGARVASRLDPKWPGVSALVLKVPEGDISPTLVRETVTTGQQIRPQWSSLRGRGVRWVKFGQVTDWPPAIRAHLGHAPRPSLWSAFPDAAFEVAKLNWKVFLCRCVTWHPVIPIRSFSIWFQAT